MTAQLYGEFIEAVFKGTHDLSSDTFYIMLCTSSYTPNKDTHALKTDVTNEASGPGYTAGGKALTSLTCAYNPSTHKLEIDCSNVQWTTSTITAHYAVIYNYSVVKNPLVGYFDFGEDKSSSNDTFGLNINADGLISVPV